MSVDAKTVKVLREKTGAGMMDCKRALVETDGDLEKAVEALRKAGVAKAEKKADREVGEGRIGSYIHAGGKIGVLIELNCETDFVARTPEFRELIHNVAMQIAAMSPRYLSKDQLPEGTDLPAQEVCLLEQPFIKDPSRSINELVLDVIARVGENVQIRRFERFGLGE